jgi:hypothetical protein
MVRGTAKMLIWQCLVAIALDLIHLVAGPCVSQSVAQVAIQSQVAYQGTGIVSVHDVEIAMWY